MEAHMTLLADARKMDADALIKIFDLYAPALYKYANRLCNNAVMADQIVGEIYVKLLEQFYAGAGPGFNLRSYLYEMVFHRVVDEAGFSHRWAPMDVVDLTYAHPYSTSIPAEKRILFETALRAIRNDLTDDQRHVIILRFMEEFSLKDTAMIMGKKVGNVKVIQNRAIAALRKALDYQIVETKAISITIRSLAHA